MFLNNYLIPLIAKASTYREHVIELVTIGIEDPMMIFALYNPRFPKL